MQTTNNAKSQHTMISLICHLGVLLWTISIILPIQSFSLLHTSTVSSRLGRQQANFDRKQASTFSYPSSSLVSLESETLLNPKQRNSSRREEWVNQSVTYYTKVRRMKIDTKKTIQEDAELIRVSSEHYFALLKIRNGKLNHAENIYRRMINEITKQRHDSGECDHAALAVSTLLLSLLKQRQGDLEGTRKTFITFFRIVGEDHIDQCSCSAKVLQAFALFEMKNGNCMKSYTLAVRAVQMDPSLKHLLQWKQFRDVARRRQELRGAVN